MSTGASAAARPSSLATLRNSAKRASEGAPAATEPASGKSTASPASASRQGQKAGAPPPSQQRPHDTRTRRAAARFATSPASRDLPIPGSPTSA